MFDFGMAFWLLMTGLPLSQIGGQTLFSSNPIRRIHVLNANDVWSPFGVAGLVGGNRRDAFGSVEWQFNLPIGPHLCL